MATVPYQLDELIASLKTSHIGNEAIELSNLQAQLQQALQAYPQSGPFPTSPVQSSSFPLHNGAPVNTPVSRTPSSIVPTTVTGRRRRRSSVASATSFRAQSRFDDDLFSSRYDLDQDMMEDVEEEAEVDASLTHVSSHATSPIQFNHPSPINSTYQAYSPTTLAYALNDPFLAHQLQTAEQRNRQPSYFAQLATTHQHTSPFYAPSSNSSRETSFSAQSQSQYPLRLTIDTSPPSLARH
ncbi:hypothetical protein Clacol_001457 [Clathrus columnatus]|uniref:Uncharacterized protein n=1 Tax=Clathrus columnatus TaxID=1419009 RepID=A0AAV5A1G2_9AGAM|nr:hypothetical protein Clacol_001457 [Clathrus columnatus]